MAISDQDIFDYFAGLDQEQLQSGALDQQIAQDMGIYSVSAQDIARATGTDAGDIQSRYEAVFPSNQNGASFLDAITSGSDTTGGSTVGAGGGSTVDTTYTNPNTSTGDVRNIGSDDTGYLDPAYISTVTSGTSVNPYDAITAAWNSGDYAATSNLLATAGITAADIKSHYNLDDATLNWVLSQGVKPAADTTNTYTKDFGGETYTLDNATVDLLTQQILGQNLTSQWQGEGYGSPEANARAMAENLAASGITDIKQVGQITKAVDESVTPKFEYTDTGQVDQDGVPIMAATLIGYIDSKGKPVDAALVKPTDEGYVAPIGTTQIIGNKLTGTGLINDYGERAVGNAFSGTYMGEGNTAYRVQFDAKGNPYFYTTGASSSDIADWGPILQLAAVIPSPLQPFAIAANATIAINQGDVLGGIAALAGLAGFSDVAAGARILKAVETKDPFAIVTSVMNSPFAGTVGNTMLTDTISLKDAGNALTLANNVSNNNWAGALTSASQLVNSPDVATAAAAARFLKAAETNNFAGMYVAANGFTNAINAANKVTDKNVALNISNSVADANSSATEGTQLAALGTDTTTTAGDAVTLPTGVQLASTGDGVFRTDVGGTPTFAESKNAGSVTAPFGYTLLSSKEADNKPEGAYYDITANAWFKPDTAVTDLTGSATIKSDADLLNSTQGDLDTIATLLDATGGTGLTDGKLSDQDLLDLVGASTVTGAKGNDIITGATGNDTIQGGTGGDTLVGAAGNDTITGGTGKDTLTGGDTNDTLKGGDGNDTLTGGDTNDTIKGADGNDVIVDDKGTVTIIDKKESCPIGTVLNAETGDCEAVDDKGEIVIKAKKDSCPIGTSLNPETGECDPIKETLTCPPGKVLNDAGDACIDETIITAKKDSCPVGTTLNPETGECDPIVEKPTTLTCPEGYEPNAQNTACIPVVKIDECKEGFHRDASGACVPDVKDTLTCPDGYELNDEGTQCIPVLKIDECKEGFHRNAQGVCVPDEKECAEGFHLENGICVSDDDKCEDGYHRENGVCVPDECPEGYIRNLETGVCEKVEKECPPGQVKDANGKCVPITKTTECKPGFEKVDGVCVPVCKPGYQRVNGVCVLICKPGYQLVNGACVPIPTGAPIAAAGGESEKTDPIYAGGMDDFNLLATLEELLASEAPKKDTKKSKDKTKMASGGYLDDLLAEQMTVDDLLKLLR